MGQMCWVSFHKLLTIVLLNFGPFLLTELVDLRCVRCVGCLSRTFPSLNFLDDVLRWCFNISTLYSKMEVYNSLPYILVFSLFVMSHKEAVCFFFYLSSKSIHKCTSSSMKLCRFTSETSETMKTSSGQIV